MSEIISLCSDDESEPPIKRINLIPKPKLELNSKERVEIIPLKKKIENKVCENVKDEIIIINLESDTSDYIKPKQDKITNLLNANANQEVTINNSLNGTNTDANSIVITDEIFVINEDASTSDQTEPKQNEITKSLNADIFQKTFNNSNVTNPAFSIKQKAIYNEIKEEANSSDQNEAKQNGFAKPVNIDSLQEAAINNSNVAVTETTSDFNTENEENNLNNFNKIEIVSVHSLTETDTDLSTEQKLIQYIDKCRIKVINTEYENGINTKVPKLQKFGKLLTKHKHYVKQFDIIISASLAKIDNFPVSNTVIKFANLYEWAKTSFIEINKKYLFSEREENVLDKLETTLSIVEKKIKELDEAEVNFDDEENSNYMKAARYKQRANQIYNKICEIKKENPNKGNMLYCKLDFSNSNYSVINQALNRKYRNTIIFPAFYEVDKCIRKCVTTNKLNISESELKEEIVNRFKDLAKLIQKKRQLDLYQHHNEYLVTGNDPAANDPALESKLREHYKQACKQRSEIVKKFQELQEQGVNPIVSSDSDDSTDIVSEKESDKDE